MERIMNMKENIGIPRLIITAFFVLLMALAVVYNLNMSLLLTDTIRRIGMNWILVLAMVPAIQSGIGPNFGLPLGILAGILGSILAIELGLTGMSGLYGAMIISIPFAVGVGILYGVILNRVKGSEMLIATYTGFSAVFFMSIVWILIPLKNPGMVWPIGQGLRVTISMEDSFGYVLDNFMRITLPNGFAFPTGLIVFSIFASYMLWLFNRSKYGLALTAVGDNPKFSEATGINVDRYRMIGTVISTVLGAIGIIVYSQSYGFVQLYQAPLMMAFPAVAAILIGGASASKAKISHVVIGVILFQGLLTVALPVANKIIPEGNLSEVLRMIVQNGIILYALTKVRRTD